MWFEGGDGRGWCGGEGGCRRLREVGGWVVGMGWWSFRGGGVGGVDGWMDGWCCWSGEEVSRLLCEEEVGIDRCIQMVVLVEKESASANCDVGGVCF